MESELPRSGNKDLTSAFHSNGGFLLAESVGEIRPQSAEASPHGNRVVFRLGESQKSTVPIREIGSLSNKWRVVKGKLDAISLLDDFGQLTWKRKSNQRALHVCTLGVSDKNRRGLSARKFSHMRRKGEVNFHSKDFPTLH